MNNIETIQRVGEGIHRAATPTAAAEAALAWLSVQVGAAAIGLLAAPGAEPLVVATPGDLPDAGVMAWMRLDNGWWAWEQPRTTNGGHALLVPLHADGQTYGILWQSLPADVRTPATIERVLLLANLLAGQLRYLRAQADTNANRLVGSLQQQAERQGVAASVSRALIANQTREEALYAVTELLCHRFSYRSVKVLLLSADGETLHEAMVYTANGPLAGAARTLSVAALPLCVEALRGHEAVVVNDTAQDARAVPDTLGDDVLAEVVLPLRSGQRTLGVLTLQSAHRHAFGGADVEMLQSIADQTAIALDKLQLLDEVRARVRDLAALTEISLLVNATLDLEQLAGRVYEAVERLQRPDVFAFAMTGRQGEGLHLYTFEQGRPVARRPLPNAFPPESFITQVMASTMPVFWANDAQRQAYAADFAVAEVPYASAVCVPMTTKGNVVGALCSYAVQPHAFDENSLQVVMALANSVAVAIENAEMFAYTTRRMHELAVINEVSQLLARSYGDADIWSLVAPKLEALFTGSTLYIGLLSEDSAHLHTTLFMQDGDMRPHASRTARGLTAVVLTGRALHVRDRQSVNLARDFDITSDPTEPGAEARSWMGVPLRDRSDNVVGIIGVFNTLPQHFDDQDVSLLMTVAAQISLAMDNMRLLEAERERRQIANTLIDVGRVVAGTLRTEEVLERILEQVRRVVDYDSAHIMLNTQPNVDLRQMVVAAAMGGVRDEVGTHYEYTDNSLMLTAIRGRQPLIVDDVQQTAGWATISAATPLTNTVRAWLAVPMLVADRTIGVITLEKSQPGYYQASDAATAFALARQAAIAVENARLHERLRANYKEMRARARRIVSMHRIATVTSSTLDRTRILRDAAQLLQNTFDVPRSFIALTNADGSLSVAFPPADPPPTFAVSDGVLHRALLREHEIVALRAADAPDIHARAVLEATGANALLLAPLVSNQHFVGLMGLVFNDPTRDFADEERQTLMAIARQVAVAIYNAELYRDALEANRLKSQFLANMSHELRTPLNAILGYSELMLNGKYGPLQPLQADRLTRVIDNGQHLLALINDVLDLSKIESSQLELALRPTPLADVVRAALSDILPQLERKGLAFDLALADDLPPVLGDAARLRQVVTNLLSNAVKFTPGGFVALTAYAVTLVGGQPTPPLPTLHLPATLVPPDGVWLVLQVRDSGIGIRPQDQAIIFDAFRQADASSTRQYEGTGLGLAIARQMVELHGGALWVESEEGSGSLFTMLLPAAPPGDVAAPLALAPGTDDGWSAGVW